MAARCISHGLIPYARYSDARRLGATSSQARRVLQRETIYAQLWSLASGAADFATGDIAILARRPGQPDRALDESLAKRQNVRLIM